MDLHIVYHIIVYTVLFIPITLFLKKGPIFLLLIFLPLLGEIVQIGLAKTFPSISYFWFSFELIDVGTNTIGSLIGIVVVRVVSFLKGCLSF